MWCKTIETPKLFPSSIKILKAILEHAPAPELLWAGSGRLENNLAGDFERMAA